MSYRVCFVCMGNICRSPTAEGVFREHAKRLGLLDDLLIESAGIGDWHVGQPPDRRAILHARRRGYDLSALRARQVRRRDFAEFDHIVAMDRGHLELLRSQCPPEHQPKLRLLIKGRDVPDPYYGGPEGFDQVLDMVEAGCLGLLDLVREQLRGGG